ncbi:MAG: fimbrial protein [Notoacmeibacter sp.]|nr:fimbrial protein [Notoacmeibacter sp.]
MTKQVPTSKTEDGKPLDPEVEKVRRKMVRFFAINIGILMFALMAVLAIIVYKVTRPSAPSGAMATGEIRLGPGERVVSQSLGDGQLSLLVEDGNGSRTIVIADAQSGRVVARLKITGGE